ncbi:MAG TPA: class I SAM-dependent methyltransferase [Thermomicrobiaceae bacterium]|nr:class I SAM-dependent methyltransferase [Thermomicrobiaceae bacterium]
MRESQSARTGRRRVLQTAFHLLYRFGGRGYDPLVRVLFGSAWDEWRTATIPWLDQDPVLDLGCGTGVLLAQLSHLGIRSLGIDGSRSMLTAAHQRGARPLVRADAYALPLRGRSIGACVATFPAPYILERAALDEVARVLRPGGRFVVLLGGAPSRPPGSLIRWLLRLAYGDQREIPVPKPSLLSHELLPGSWQLLELPAGQAVIWLAQRRPDAHGVSPESSE